LLSVDWKALEHKKIGAQEPETGFQKPSLFILVAETGINFIEFYKERVMAEKKVYLMIKVRTPFELIGEFNEFWEKVSLPIWIKYGAKHIGSFANFVGDPINEIVRLFEFDSYSHWEKWEKFLGDSEEGKAHVKRLSRYIVSLERKLLTSIY
jgi:hypothetical protein